MPRPLRAVTLIAAAMSMSAPLHADIIYVDANLTTGLNNGSSWENAYRAGGGGIQEALADAQPGDEIWIADGRYRTGATRNATFTLKNGVTLYGGFAGGETSLDQRDPAVNIAMLTGDLNNNDGAFPTGWDENAIHVITATARNQSAVLDGFTISAAYANGSISPQDRGGAIVCLSGNPTFRNLVILGNAATTAGGAVYLTTASPTFTDCRFEANSAGSGAGGAVGMFNACNPVFTRCRFIANSAGRGGAIDLSLNCQPDVVNSLLTANVASNPTDGGGALRVDLGSQAEVINCTIYANTAVQLVGGVFTTNALTRIHNSVVWANTAQGGVTTGQQLAGSNYEATYNCVQHGFPGAGNIDADPALTTGPGGTYQPLAGSPCIDAGDNARVLDGVVVDLAHAPRLVDDPATPDTGQGKSPLIDIGAFEFQGASGDCPQVELHPASAQLCPNQDYAITVTILSGVPTGYQWRRDSLDIPGATGPTYDFETIDNNDEGVYTCAVFSASCPPAVTNTCVVTVCQTDWTCDDVVNSTDVSEFINGWFADQVNGTLFCDFDHNGVVNSTDVSNFINVWFQESGELGCAG